MLVVKYLFCHNFLKALSGWICLIPTIINTFYETCIHNIQLQSCNDSRGRAWVNTMVVKRFVVLLFVSCFAVIDPNKHTYIHTKVTVNCVITIVITLPRGNRNRLHSDIDWAYIAQAFDPSDYLILPYCTGAIGLVIWSSA